MDQSRTAQMQSHSRMECLGAVISECVPKRSSANEVHDTLAALADRAQDLAARAESALQSVSRGIEPETNECRKDSRWHPPLFENYLGRAMSIADALRRIEAALDRLEI